MFNKEASAGDNSNIVNTHGSNNLTNITNTNIDTKTVEVIVKGILYDSLPRFQEEAKIQVKDSIKSYIEDLIKELEAQKISNDLINEKLPSPDIQYSIFESAKTYARSPRRAEKATLINLVVNKINTESDDFDELSELDMAIEAASKMNANQIKALALVYFVINIIKYGLSHRGNFFPMDPVDTEKCKQQGDYYFFNGENVRSKAEIHNAYIYKYSAEIATVFPEGDLRPTNFNMPLVLGCIRKSSLEKIALESIILKRTGIDIKNKSSALKISPLIDRIEILGGIDNVSTIILTELGYKIAAAYVSTKMRLLF